MKPFLLVLSLLGVSWLVQGQVDRTQPPEEGYIRFVTDDSGEKLQTAVRRFRKGNQHVDLVAVVHVADKRYYDALNRYLANYDVVLYELIGGRYPTEKTVSDVAEIPQDMTGMVGSLQQMLKSALALEFQLDAIDYQAANFVHADMDSDQFLELMLAKNESLESMISRMMKVAEDGSIEELPLSEADLTKVLGQMLTAAATGDSEKLKRSLAPIMAESEGLMNLLEGEEGSVIISERNKIVIQKLHEVMAKRSGGKYAVFYGAGHMSDLEERLVANGFQKGDVVWADAWTLGKESGTGSKLLGGTDFSSSAVDTFLKLLEDNPDIIGTIQDLGEMIEKFSTGTE